MSISLTNIKCARRAYYPSCADWISIIGPKGPIPVSRSTWWAGLSPAVFQRHCTWEIA